MLRATDSEHHLTQRQCFDNARTGLSNKSRPLHSLGSNDWNPDLWLPVQHDFSTLWVIYSKLFQGEVVGQRDAQVPTNTSHYEDKDPACCIFSPWPNTIPFTHLSC